jgi:hypothetical protein
VRVRKILCTLLLFGSLAVEANEATAPKRGNSPVKAVDSATDRDAHAAAKPVNGRASPRTAAEKGAGEKDRDTGMGVARRPATTQQMGRANADRLRSLLGAQARGRVVRQPLRRPVGSARAPTFVRGAGQERRGANPTQSGATPARQLTGANPTQFSATPTRQLTGANPTQVGATPARQFMRGVASPAPVASPSAARPVPTLSAMAIHSTNGLPRAPGLAVVGGPVVGRGVHNSSIDGTRPPHKF